MRSDITETYSNELRKEAVTRMEAANQEVMMRAEGAKGRVEADNLDETGKEARVEKCNAEGLAGQQNSISA